MAERMIAHPKIIRTNPQIKKEEWNVPPLIFTKAMLVRRTPPRRKKLPIIARKISQIEGKYNPKIKRPPSSSMLILLYIFTLFIHQQ